MELAWFVGVDWGSQTHQACVIDVAGKLLGERAFEQEHGEHATPDMLRADLTWRMLAVGGLVVAALRLLS